MIGEKKLTQKLDKLLARSGADEREVVYVGTELGLTRYANSFIHQNVVEDDRRIFVRSVLGRRVGVASTNSLAPADLARAADDSVEIARNQPENPDFPGLPEPAGYRDIDTFDEATALFRPSDRAKRVKVVIAEAKRRHYTVAGALATSSQEIFVRNSRGVRAYRPSSAATINMIAMSDSSSGYASSVARKVSELDVSRLAKKAVDKCRMSLKPRELDPGEYEAILEPPAIAELLEWLSYVGFGSKPFQQGISFLVGRIGRKVTSDKITIYDNGLDPKNIAFPFDFEGVPKKKVVFIDKGVARGVVHDLASAAKSKTKSTGHAVLPDMRDMGALPLHIFMAPGRARRDQMVKRVKKGILVTRFHYVNGLIDTRNAVLTGMTRDGTFLIENGEVVGGLKNLRFTDSFTRAFKSTVAVSKETERIESWWSPTGCMTVPTVHLGSFRFSGKTEF